MIKAKGTREDGSPIYIFGLSETNLHRLRLGKPIAFSLKDLGAEGEVMIFFGETEASIAEELKEFFGPNTRVGTFQE